MEIHEIRISVLVIQFFLFFFLECSHDYLSPPPFIPQYLSLSMATTESSSCYSCCMQDKFETTQLNIQGLVQFDSGHNLPFQLSSYPMKQVFNVAKQVSNLLFISISAILSFLLLSTCSELSNTFSPLTSTSYLYSKKCFLNTLTSEFSPSQKTFVCKQNSFGNEQIMLCDVLWSQTIIYILYIMHFLTAEIFVCFPLLSCIYCRSRTMSFLELVFSNIHRCGYRIVWKLKILIDYPCLDVFHRVLGKLFSSPCLNTFMTNLSQYLWLRRNLLSF